jgi:mRNA-degrading endonuclease YafQ of YafQ-DinJ toxin-antitoxin module
MKQLYEIRTYKQYDRDVKLAVRRGLDIEIRIISLYRTGTHADIFGKGRKR